MREWPVDEKMNLGDAEITRVAFEKSDHFIADLRPKTETFLDCIPAEQIETDAVYVAKMRGIFQSTKTPFLERQKQRAKVLECILIGHIELSEWLGEGVSTFLPTEYDDFHNRIDLIVEIPTNEMDSVLLAADLTYSQTEQNIVKKLEELKRDLTAGRGKTVKYFSSEMTDKRGIQQRIPGGVIIIDPKTMDELTRLWVQKNKKDLETHPIQYIILEQILMQLDVFQAFTKSTHPDLAKQMAEVKDSICERLKEDRYQNLSLDAIRRHPSLRLFKELLERVFLQAYREIKGHHLRLADLAWEQLPQATILEEEAWMPQAEERRGSTRELPQIRLADLLQELRGMPNGDKISWDRITRIAARRSNPGELIQDKTTGQIFLLTRLAEAIRMEIAKTQELPSPPPGSLTNDGLTKELQTQQIAIKPLTVRRLAVLLARETNETPAQTTYRASNNRPRTFYSPQLVQRVIRWCLAHHDKHIDRAVVPFDPTWVSLRELSNEFEKEMSAASVRREWNGHIDSITYMRDADGNIYGRCSPQTAETIRQNLQKKIEVLEPQKDELTLPQLALKAGLTKKVVKRLMKQTVADNPTTEYCARRRPKYGRTEWYYFANALKVVEEESAYRRTLLSPQLGEKSIYQITEAVKQHANPRANNHTLAKHIQHVLLNHSDWMHKRLVPDGNVYAYYSPEMERELIRLESERLLAQAES